MRDGLQQAGVGKPAPLVTTYLAAVYVLMHEGHTTYYPDDLNRAKAYVYNAARDGRLTRHGGQGWGEARWSLVELDAILKQTP